MPTGLTLWIVFFTLWLYALQRATHRAFTVERDHMPGIPFEPGPISAATLVFHLGLTTVLLVVILSSVYQDAQMLWFGLPGFLAPVIQGVVLMMEHSSQAGARTTRRISPHWITEQWPFALLGLSVGVAGAAWWALPGSQFPLLLVGFSAFLLTTFRLFFTYQHLYFTCKRPCVLYIYIYISPKPHSSWTPNCPLPGLRLLNFPSETL